MRHTPRHVVTDPDEVKRLVRAHPWATFVSPTAAGLVASRYPVLLDEASDGIVLVSHFGRPDELDHELGEHEVLVIVQGPHDYVSSSWYSPGDIVPTWDHVTAHLYGVRVTRFDARAKLSQNKTPDVVASVISHLEPDNPELAAEMRRSQRAESQTP